MLRNFCQRTGKRGLPYLTDITNVFESVQFLLVNVLPTAEQQEKKKKRVTSQHKATRCLIGKKRDVVDWWILNYAQNLLRL